jgi:hypothetical protein
VDEAATHCDLADQFARLGMAQCVAYATKTRVVQVAHRRDAGEIAKVPEQGASRHTRLLDNFGECHLFTQSGLDVLDGTFQVVRNNRAIESTQRLAVIVRVGQQQPGD